MSGWIRSGQVQCVDGLEHAPEAFLGLFEGDNLGTMVVRLDAANG
jgi:NADPH-dependent curcumin reductase CurA